MKTLSLLIIVIVGITLYLFLKTDIKDTKARKEATHVKVTIEKLRCKRRLKSDKSLIVVRYQGKSYSLFIDEIKCNSYQVNEEISAYYSMTFDKLFLEK